MAIKQAPTIEILEDGSQVVEESFGFIPIECPGAPCFAKTRVPIQNLFDYLESGAPLEEFLIGFPPITRDQAIKVLELARTGLFNSLSRKLTLSSH